MKRELKQQQERILVLTEKLIKFFFKEEYTPEESLLSTAVFMHEALKNFPNKEVAERIKKLLKTIVE